MDWLEQSFFNLGLFGLHFDGELPVLDLALERVEHLASCFVFLKLLADGGSAFFIVMAVAVVIFLLFGRVILTFSLEAGGFSAFLGQLKCGIAHASWNLHGIQDSKAAFLR